MIRLGLALLLSVLAGTAQAQSWLDQPGVGGSTVVQLGEARIRLPPGEWRQVSDDSRSYKSEATPLLERVFIQSNDKQVIALAYVRANGADSTNRANKGFRPNDQCFRTDVFMNDSHDLYPGQWDCMIVNHNTMHWNDTIPPLWQAAIDSTKNVGGLPHPMLYVEMSKASPSRNGFAVLRISINPALAGFSSNPTTSWAQSEWHKNNATPDRVAFLKKLQAWGEAYRPVFRKSWE